MASFAAAKSLPLLFELFGEETILVPPAVQEEITQGVERGKEHLREVVRLIEAGKLTAETLTAEDIETARGLPGSLGPGERQAIAICIRAGGRLLSNDKRVVNFCASHGVKCYPLSVVLRLLWETQVTSKTKVKTMMRRMQTVEGIVFKEPKAILKS
ncbi:MAG: hypothetical protein HY260_23740 [Chloroflexi bacterium]|nr:hypothetical protein [Chloroflexota bacterium]